MSHIPHDGSADHGLSGALLHFVDDDQLPSLRQALSGFNHRFRNLLNGMKMSFYLAKRTGPQPLPERWGELDQTYRAVEQFFHRVQAIYQTMPLTLVKGRFGALVSERARAWSDGFQQYGNTLTIEPPDQELDGEFDPMCLNSALDAFIAWRAASLPSGGRATLKWTTTSDGFSVVWSEEARETPDADPDAPPIDAAVAQAPLSATTGALSIPLLARVISEHQGTLQWSREPQVQARLQWPLTASSSSTGTRASASPARR